MDESHVSIEEATFQYKKSVVREIVRNMVCILTQIVVCSKVIFCKQRISRVSLPCFLVQDLEVARVLLVI